MQIDSGTSLFVRGDSTELFTKSSTRNPTQKIKLPKDLAGHKNGQLPDELLAPVPGGKLHKCAVRSYKHMLNAAKAAGVELKPTSTVDTYRPYSVQYNAFMQRYRAADIS